MKIHMSGCTGASFKIKKSRASGDTRRATEKVHSGSITLIDKNSDLSLK